MQFRTPVRVQFVPRERLRADARADGATLLPGAFGATLQSLRVMSRSEFDRARDLSGIVEGYYAHGTVVVDAALPAPVARFVVVHELTHALDEQHYPLDAVYASARSVDERLALAAVGEGDAERVAIDYRHTLSRDDQGLITTHNRQAGNADCLTCPVQMLEVFPYRYGERFLRAVSARGGEAAVNRVFVDPPHTTAAVIEPDRYYRDDRHDVSLTWPAVPAGAALVGRGTMGEARIGILVGSATRATTAGRISAGWVDDRFTTYRTGSRYCTRWSLQWAPATVADAAGLFVRWLGSTAVTRAGSSLSVQSCG